jgi:putative ABC transport system permease protein
MISIGWKNLKHDPWRALVAVLGVVFAVVLVTVEVGMLLGLFRNSSLLIDHSKADIWVSTVDVKTFDFATPLSERKRYRIEAIPGVERVEEYNVCYSVWKLPSGGNANCQVVAFDERGELAAPLNVVEGSVEALHNQDAIMIDEGERAKLGNVQLGDWVEVMDHRAKVVGFTRGMRSFTTTPYVFTSVRRSEHYAWLLSGGSQQKQSIYFLVKTKAGADVESVRQGIAGISGIEAHTRESFSMRTRKYWLIETGVGLGFVGAALLGLLVGAVVVSQILYAMTMEKLPEFGVMKAMGASMREISRVVLDQSLICGGIGLLLGLAISYAIGTTAGVAGTAVEIPVGLVIAVTILTSLLCSGAALFSIFRLRRVDPATVFRT